MPSRRAALAVIGALGCASACATSAAEPGDVVRQDVRARLGHGSDARPRPARRNFGTLLASQQIGSDQLEAMLASLEGVVRPAQDARGPGVAAPADRQRTGAAVRYEIDGRSVLRITPNADTAGEFVAEVVPYNVRVTRVEVSGNINEETSSLSRGDVVGG